MPVVSWVQDFDGDAGTIDDLVLYHASWTGAWSIPAPVAPQCHQADECRTSDPPTVMYSRFGAPPRECCDCPPGEECCAAPPCVEERNTTGPGAGGEVDAVGALDPNLKLGPGAAGAAGYVPVESPLPYVIYFENQASATAAALEVHVTDQLDSDLDHLSVELLEMGFGSCCFTIPIGTNPYFHTALIDGWAHNPEQGWHTGETPLQVDLSASADPISGLMTWSIVAVDPNTGLPPEDP